MVKKLGYILVFALILMTVAGIVIGIVVLQDQKSFEREIELSQSGVTQEKLNISLEGLYPSKSVEYSIKFGSEATNKYDVTISFNADKNIELAQYLEVNVELNGEKVSIGNLTEYLKGKTVLLNLEMNGKQAAELVLRYTMPSEVENEAQNLSADFSVEIEAKPEK